MKLKELFEDISIDFLKYAKSEGFKKIKSIKKINGKSYTVFIYRKEYEIDDTDLIFEYIVNTETESWAFNVSTEEISAVEISSGEDLDSLNNHIKKKHKISKHQIQKHFKD